MLLMPLNSYLTDSVDAVVVVAIAVAGAGVIVPTRDDRGGHGFLRCFSLFFRGFFLLLFARLALFTHVPRDAVCVREPEPVRMCLRCGCIEFRSV